MTPVAGWYQDPETPANLRWWDGNAWTPHTRPKEQISLPHPSPSTTGSKDQAPHTFPASGPTPQDAPARDTSTSDLMQGLLESSPPPPPYPKSAPQPALRPSPVPPNAASVFVESPVSRKKFVPVAIFVASALVVLGLVSSRFLAGSGDAPCVADDPGCEQPLPADANGTDPGPAPLGTDLSASPFTALSDRSQGADVLVALQAWFTPPEFVPLVPPGSVLMNATFRHNLDDGGSTSWGFTFSVPQSTITAEAYVERLFASARETPMIEDSTFTSFIDDEYAETYAELEGKRYTFEPIRDGAGYATASVGVYENGAATIVSAYVFTMGVFNPEDELRPVPALRWAGNVKGLADAPVTGLSVIVEVDPATGEFSHAQAYITLEYPAAQFEEVAAGIRAGTGVIPGRFSEESSGSGGLTGTILAEGSVFTASGEEEPLSVRVVVDPPGSEDSFILEYYVPLASR